MFEPTVRDEVLCVASPGARWLASGPGGGFVDADAAYNLTVPTGFSRTDLDAYVEERLHEVGFGGGGGDGGDADESGGASPALLTGVSMEHARGARAGDVVAYATAGLSNPAALPMDPQGEPTGPGNVVAAAGNTEEEPNAGGRRRRHDGTVNLLVGTTRALENGALAELLATAVEAKAATLLGTAGVPGTTSDAVAVATDPDGEPASFCGSATEVGAAARACVREAVRSSLESRYPDGGVPGGSEDAEHGVVTTRPASVFEP